MADVHRRIELQEQEDLQYLIENVRRAAADKLNLALPPIEGEDALRARVEELVQEFIQTLLRSASPNILINGHTLTPAILNSLLSSSGTSSTSAKAKTRDIEVFEPVNSKLVTRAQELAALEASLVLELGDLKRSAPGVVAAKQKEVYASGLEDQERLLNEVKVAAARQEGAGEHCLTIGKLERQERVEEAWGRAVDGLGVESNGMGTTAARMGEARRAGGYALAER